MTWRAVSARPYHPERTRNYNRRVEVLWAVGSGGQSAGEQYAYYPGMVLSYHNKTQKYEVGPGA